MFGFTSNISVTAVGNVGQDPVKKSFGEGENAKTVVSFSVAVSQYNPKSTAANKRDTLWLNCQTFQEKDGKSIMEYVKKGAIVQVTGEPKLRLWEKDGTSHIAFDLNVSSITKLGKKEEKTESVPEQAAAASASNSDDASDIPF